MFLKLPFLAMLFFLLYGAMAKKKAKYLYFENILTNYNPEYSSKYDVKIAPDHSSINMEWKLEKTAPADIWFHLKMSRKNAKTKKSQNIFERDLNLCNFLGKDIMNFNIMQIWLNNFLKVVNLPKTCPITNGTYYLNNFKADRESLPPFVGHGMYRIGAVFHIPEFGDVMLTNITLIVIVKEK